MTYLVAGNHRVDAGKTTFTIGLVNRLDTIGFKPRGGNDYWFDHHHYQQAISEGRLFGKDAERLAAVSSGELTPESINPVHRLWRPAPDGDGFIGRSDRRFLLDRVGDEFILNAEADIPSSAQDALPLADAPRISTIEDLNSHIQARHLPQLTALADRIENTDQAVIESYGNVARPIRDVSIQRVAVVAPEQVHIFDGDRYLTACDVAGTSPIDGELEERVADVIELLDPISSCRLPPLTTDQLSHPDRIEEHYAAVYDELLAGYSNEE